MKHILGDKTGPRKRAKEDVRYHQKRNRRLLLQDSLSVTPIKEILNSDTPKQDYIPFSLTYSEALKVSEDRKSETKKLCKGSFYLNEVDDDDEETLAHSSDYKYWMKLSKDFNERLAKEPRNVDLWMEFVNFQDRAFVHLFNDGKQSSAAKSAKSGEASCKASNRALAERKLALLDSAIKKNPHSVALQCFRLEIGELVWDAENLCKQWNGLVYNFPNNMDVWHRCVYNLAVCVLFLILKFFK